MAIKEVKDLRSSMEAEFKNRESFKSTTFRVTAALVAIMLCSNFFVTNIISYLINESLGRTQDRYLAEILSHISSTVEITMEKYETMTMMMSASYTLTEFLEESDKENPMHEHEYAGGVIYSMRSVADMFPYEIINVAILDVEQDGYLTHDGSYSNDSFSFRTRPYYNAVTLKDMVVTEPYQDSVTGQMVVSIAYPIFKGTNALGIMLIDVSLDGISDMVKDSQFGSSGNNLILDNSNNILAYSDTSLIGKPVESLGFEGAEYLLELANPTGETFSYVQDGVRRLGKMETIDSLGWTMFTGMDRNEYRLAANIIIIVAAALQLVAMIIALSVAAKKIKKLLNPIKDINTAMKALAAGDLDVVVKHVGDDEIGELCQNVRLTTNSLSSYVREIERQMLLFENGDFNVRSRVEFKGSFKSIEKATDNFIRLMSQTLEQLQTIIEQVSIGTDQVAHGAQTLAMGSMEQTESISMLNEHIESVTEKIQNSSTYATNANESVTLINEELANSNRQMNHMLDAMNEMGDRSDEIQKIVATIEEIALQINLLALNASVEAARAGEAGKGFSVVADEVRNLAGKTSEAVKSTDSLISSNTEAVEKGRALADETANSLVSVTENLHDFVKLIEHISESSVEQADEMSSVTSNVIEISQVVQTNSAISEESAASAEELSSQTTLMKSTVDRFHTRHTN